MDYAVLLITFVALVLQRCTPLTATDNLHVMLNSTQDVDSITFNQQEVFFTCTVRGSSNVILEWSSVEYIGQGGVPLQLLSFNGTDTNVSSTTRSSTYAVRRSVSNENDLTVIVSDLRIVASIQYPMATVICSASANGASLSRNITLETRALPPQATKSVTSNSTTIPDTNDITTTATETTEDLTDSTPENQQSCTCNSTNEILLGIILALSLVANVISILIIVIILVRSNKSLQDREFDEDSTPTRDSPVQSPTKTDDSKTPGAAPKPKMSDASLEKEVKQKKGLLGALHGKIQQFGLENCLCLNNNSDVHIESEETVIAALTALYEALRDGQHSKFKDAIDYLCDDLHIKKVPDEMLNKCLEKFRVHNILHS